MILGSRSPIFSRVGSVISSYIPAVTNTYDLGSSSKTFRNLYLGTNLIFTAASAKIIPGATSLVFRNNADSADNLTISNAGLVTARAGFVATTGNITITVGDLMFSSTTPRIVPGSTSLTFTNNADSANNLVIADNGAITLRNTITFTAGNQINGSSGANLILASTNGYVDIYTHSSSPVRRWRFGVAGTFEQDATNGSDLIMNRTNATIRMGVASTNLWLSGGTGISSSDGALLQLSGISAGAPGEAALYGGTNAAAHITMRLSHASATFRVRDASNNTVVSSTAAGLLSCVGVSTSGDITIAKASAQIVSNSDSRSLYLSGGTNTTAANGAVLLLSGVTHAGLGVAHLYTGSNVGAELILTNSSAAGSITFRTGSSVARWAINSSGQLVQDGTNGGSFIMSRGSTTPIIQGLSATPADISAITNPNIVTFGSTALAAIKGTNDAFGSFWSAFKSRATNGSADTIVQSGDAVLDIRGYGANGTTFEQAATIQMAIDGTPGASADMPGRISFLVSPDGSSTPTEAMRISQTRVISLNSSAYTASRPLSLDGSKNIVNTAYDLTNANYATAAWTDFSGTISWTGSGAGSVINVTVNYALSCKIGKIVHIAFSVTSEVSGGTLNYYQLTAPHTGRNNGAFSQDTGGIVIGNSDIGQVRVQSGSSAIRIYPRDLSTTFATGTRTISGNFFYVEN